MHTEALRARIARLEKLSLGLMKERVLWKNKLGPMMAAEQMAYLDGISQTLAGVEAARIALVHACQRLEALGRLLPAQDQNKSNQP